MFNYPTSRSYLSEDDIAGLREGDCLHCDSGMGGSFSMRFVAHEGDKMRFENQSPDFEGCGDGLYTIDEVRQQLYDLVFDPINQHEITAIARKPFDQVQFEQRKNSRRNR